MLLETDVTGAAQARYTVADGEVVAQTKGGATSYLLHDGQGNVRTLTNASGTITESHIYDAYGALRDPSGSPTTRYLYTGQMLDAGTGLYNLRARNYNTALGQFLSRDTVNDGLNFYGYVHGNPINGFDPSGHAAGAPVADPAEAESETAAIEGLIDEPAAEALQTLTAPIRTPAGVARGGIYRVFAQVVAALALGAVIDCTVTNIVCNANDGNKNGGFGGGNAGIGIGAGTGTGTGLGGASPTPLTAPPTQRGSGSQLRIQFQVSPPGGRTVHTKTSVAVAANQNPGVLKSSAIASLKQRLADETATPYTTKGVVVFTALAIEVENRIQRYVGPSISGVPGMSIKPFSVDSDNLKLKTPSNEQYRIDVILDFGTCCGA